MNRSVLAAMFGIIFIMSGCSGLVDEEQMEVFFNDLGDTSITVYPTYIKRMDKDSDGKPTGRDASNSGYELNETERLAAYLRCECLADVTVSSDNVPLGGDWQKTQAGIFKASAQAFGEYVAANPIETEYAMIAEYAIPFDRIWAVHAYVVNASGEPVWILHLNEHFDVFTEINPEIPADGTDVLLKFLRFGWPVTSAKCSYQASELKLTNHPRVFCMISNQSGLRDLIKTTSRSVSRLSGIARAQRPYPEQMITLQNPVKQTGTPS